MEIISLIDESDVTVCQNSINGTSHLLFSCNSDWHTRDDVEAWTFNRQLNWNFTDTPNIGGETNSLTSKNLTEKEKYKHDKTEKQSSQKW